jgi:hypothetical protein
MNGVHEQAGSVTESPLDMTPEHKAALEISTQRSKTDTTDALAGGVRSSV